MWKGVEEDGGKNTQKNREKNQEATSWWQLIMQKQLGRHWWRYGTWHFPQASCPLKKKNSLKSKWQIPHDGLSFIRGLKWKSKVQRLSLRGDEEDEGVWQVVRVVSPCLDEETRKNVFKGPVSGFYFVFFNLKRSLEQLLTSPKKTWL